MSRRRFFVPGNLIGDAFAVLPPEQSHHLRNVLRIKPGEQVELLDGDGNGYTGIVEMDGSTVRIRSLRKLQLPIERRQSLILAMALIKPQKFEWVLEKGTELGVDEFVPLKTRFCQARGSDDVIAARVPRWRRIAQEACKQSRHVTVPLIREPAAFGEFIATDQPRTARFLLYEGGGGLWDGQVPECERIILCVGPEGGWAPDEVQSASEAGFHIISFGPQILRAETAALAAVAVFQFLLSTR